MACIIVDDRENRKTKRIKPIIPLLEKYANAYNIKANGKYMIHVIKRRITTGDFAISLLGNGSSIIAMSIERKTWKDLSASISDSRMDNARKMMDLRAQRGCNLLYLIEGHIAFPKKTTRLGRKPASCLLGKLRHLLVRDDIPYVQTKNQEHTAEFLVDLANDYYKLTKSGDISHPFQNIGTIDEIHTIIDTFDRDDKPKTFRENLEKFMGEILPLFPHNPLVNFLCAPDRILNNIKFMGGDDDSENFIIKIREDGEILLDVPILTKTHKKDDETIIHSMWCAISNVSEKSATILARNYHISDVLCNRLDKDEVAELKYDSGSRFGGARAAKIVKPASRRKRDIKILSRIPRVSETIAKIILENIKMEELTRERIDKEDIRELRRSLANLKRGTRRLGDSLANSVVKFLVPNFKTDEE